MRTGFSLKVLAVAAAGLLAVVSTARAGGPEPGEKAPELLVKDWLNGGPVDVRTCENEVVVIWFFHSVAPDMAQYTKNYVDMLAEYGKKGLRIVGVSREQQAALVNFSDETKIPFPLATDDGSWKGNYGIDAYPWTYIVDVYGEIAWKGNGNRIEWVVPQIEKALKEVKRINVKPEDTGKNFDKVWRAIENHQWPNAIKFCQALAKSDDEEDRKDAETILAEMNAIADARLKRVEELEKRKDFVSGQQILQSVQKTFVGLPQVKTAKEILERWMKTREIKAELDAQRLYEEGRVLENNRHYKKAAEMYRAAMQYPGTRAAGKAAQAVGDLQKRGLVK